MSKLGFEADGVPSELLPKPLGWQVLLAPVKLRETTDGGIALPDYSQESRKYFINIFKVLAIGDNAFDSPHFRGGRTEGLVKPWFKVGDIVVARRQSGENIAIRHAGKNHNLLLIQDEAPSAVFNDTTGIEALL